MRPTFVFSLLCLAACAADLPVTVTRVDAPAKALIFEVVVPASRTAVWKAFSDSTELSTWLTPGAVVDLRRGGEFTARYPGGRTGGGHIVDFTPEQELIVTAMAPEQFPTVRSERTTAIFQLVARGESATLVRLVQTGWKQGQEWDKAYEYLAKGNATLLTTLQKRFTTGPIPWPQSWVDEVTKK